MMWLAAVGPLVTAFAPPPRTIRAPRTKRHVVTPDVALRVAAAVPTLYALMSVNEYVTHRYYQHAGFNDLWISRLVGTIRGGGHVEHHAETLDDMTLKTDDKWRRTKPARSLDDDPYRGTAFTWQVTGLMTLQMLPTTLPVFKFLLGLSLPVTFAILLPGMLLHALVWNALHPGMHALPDVPASVGAPSGVLAGLRDTPYFRFLYKNHQGHHIVGGRGNYNVACPGADLLFGTYVPASIWQPQAKSTYASHHGDDLSIDAQIANHVEREAAFFKT